MLGQLLLVALLKRFCVLLKLLEDFFCHGLLLVAIAQVTKVVEPVSQIIVLCLRVRTSDTEAFSNLLDLTFLAFSLCV